ncbi:hypothetical protein CLV80_102324 [Yoonia maritima]|uniref:Excalibur calcium-binding domain-containing protein n=1 Tax=Yoonia maritima TaxID=1435347 RepID=A0A2T0W3A1_9RHOB|nr:hypothetical protein [Yoonia maritima]PRY79679.1 hypothetical protein CLV80_102324 [Yoonia maritima]
MKFSYGIALSILALGACATTDAQRARGVGFDDYSNYELERARREAALTSSQTSIIPPAKVNSVVRNDPAPLPGTQAIASSELANAGIGQAQPSQTDREPLSALKPAAVEANNISISDEQNFDAVSGRETIESDAARRAAQAAAREQVAPTAVPDRPSNTGPNIVEYAVNAPNVKGQEWYSRSLLSTQGRYQRNCATYATPDDAQRDFLSRGGPERDRRGIDPDGDGFACGWDPAPFKMAFGN